MCIEQGAGLGIQDSGYCRATDTALKLRVRSAGRQLTPESCLLAPERGASLIELVMFIVIIGIALAGILLVMNQTTGHSADVLVRKQALAVAESLLEEIEAQSAIGANPCALPASTVRATFNKVCDYNDYATTAGVLDMAGSAVSGLNNFNVAPPIEVVWTSAAWAGIPAGSAVTITVHVTDPAGKTYDATGYRTAY